MRPASVSTLVICIFDNPKAASGAGFSGGPRRASRKNVGMFGTQSPEEPRERWNAFSNGNQFRKCHAGVGTGVRRHSLAAHARRPEYQPRRFRAASSYERWRHRWRAPTARGGPQTQRDDDAVPALVRPESADASFMIGIANFEARHGGKRARLLRSWSRMSSDIPGLPAPTKTAFWPVCEPFAAI